MCCVKETFCPGKWPSWFLRRFVDFELLDVPLQVAGILSVLMHHERKF